MYPCVALLTGPKCLNAFVCRSVRTPLVTRPLHTRSPRGSTVNEPKSPESVATVRLPPCVSSSPLGFQTETRRDGVTRPSAYRSFSLTPTTYTSRETSLDHFSTQSRLADDVTKSVIAPKVRVHPRDGWQREDPPVRPGTTRARKSIAAAYPNTRVRREFNRTPCNATRARARAPPRQRYAFYTRRAAITWPMSVSCTLDVYADVYRLDEEGKGRRRRRPGRRRREKSTHARAWFQ